METKSPHLTENYSFRKRLINPLRLAIMIAGSYLVFGVIYIRVSSHIAASSVLSKHQLEYIEMYKGTAFIVITAGLLFAILLVLFRRLNLRQEKIEQQHDAIVLTGKHAMAGIFASSVAHDLNNILLVSMFALEKLSEYKDIEISAIDHIERLQKAHGQISNYVKMLEDVGGKYLPIGKRKTDIAATVSNAIKLAATHIKVKHCSIEHDLPEQCIAAIDEALIQGAVLNLMVNAAEATDRNGRILVKLFEDAGTVRLEVHDDGPGIPEESRGLVSEPFFTTKEDGTGLGLFSFKYCAEAHGGSIGIDTSDLGGALIYMVFPKTSVTKAKQNSMLLHHAHCGVN